MGKTHFPSVGGQKWVDSFYRPGQPVGNVFYVHHSGSSSGPGYSPETAYSTINAAIAVCTANQGDTVYVLPGHAETIVAAAGVSFGVAGVAVIGLGEGATRPTVTFGTLTTATIAFAAANCRLSNIRCVNAIDSLASFIAGSADNAVIENCDFIGASTVEALCGVAIPTTYDNWVIRGCKFIQGTDPTGTNAGAGTGAVYLVDSENVLIEDCEFRGNWETAFIHNKTTAAANLWVRRCYGICSLADAQPFLLVTGATGGADRCSFITPAETQVTEATLSGTFGAGFFNFLTYYGNDGGGGQLAVAGQAAAT